MDIYYLFIYFNDNLKWTYKEHSLLIFRFSLIYLFIIIFYNQKQTLCSGNQKLYSIGHFIG